MKKLIRITLAFVVLYLSSGLSNADSSTLATDAFQKFDNQYNIGYGYQSGGLVNGSQNTSSFSAGLLNIEVERLFDAGIWLNGDFYMVTNYSQPNLGPLNGGNGSSNAINNAGAEFGQNPFMFGLNFKIGYAFNLINHHLQIIPYALLGRNDNWATSTVVANGGENLSGDYFYTGGLGSRLSYRINDTIMLYADELYAYNWDNSGAVKSIQTDPTLYGKSYAATNYTFTTTLGARFNLVKNFQLGVSALWNNFQPQSNIAGVMYTPTNTYGGMLSVGLTY